MSEEEKTRTNIIVSIIFVFIAIIGCVFAFIYIDRIKSFKLFGDSNKTKEKEVITPEDKPEEKKLITSYEYLNIIKNDVTSYLEEYNTGKYTKYVYYDASSKNISLYDQKESDSKLIATIKCLSNECSLITPDNIKEGNHLLNILVLIDGENYLILDVNSSKLYNVTNMSVNEYSSIKYVDRNVYYNLETKGIIFASKDGFKYYSVSENDIVNEIKASYYENNSYNYDKYFVASYISDNECLSSLVDIYTGEETKKIKGYYTSPNGSDEKTRFGVNTKLFYSDCDKKQINILDEEYNPVFDEFYDNLEYDLGTNIYTVYNNDGKGKTYNMSTKKITIK